MRVRALLACALALVVGAAPLFAAPAAHAPARKLATGITGTIRASGLDDPQYVLSFEPVQQLILAACDGPVAPARATEMLASSPAAPADLLRLGLLREERGAYRLNYLVLTIADQRRIHAVAPRFAKSLAEATLAKRDRFDRIVSRIPDPRTRADLEFALVAGVFLNWDGLKFSTERGYRAAPVKRPNGDSYLVHSYEVGFRESGEGLYVESHTYPGPRISFSTFGDGPSIPRRLGLPDALFDPLEEGLDAFAKPPEVYAAAKDALVGGAAEALDDAGAILEAAAGGGVSNAVLDGLPIPPERRERALGLLLATAYLRKDRDRYAVAVPMLSSSDGAIADETLAAGREVLDAWLSANYRAIATELADLSPMRSGLPFELAFSEVWHAIFGVATRELAERGFYANPRAPGAARPGFVPLVWASSVLAGPD